MARRRRRRGAGEVVVGRALKSGELEKEGRKRREEKPLQHRITQVSLHYISHCHVTYYYTALHEALQQRITYCSMGRNYREQMCRVINNT